MITSQQVRIILDRNQNGLDGLARVAAGHVAAPGLYWDPASRKVDSIESPRTAERELVLLSHRLDETFDELVRLMAMGGGGHTGRAIEYHARESQRSSHA